MACEGRATGSGVSCRVRRPIWQPIGYPAAPTHPPHAIGTRGPLGDQNTSIEASFDFSVQRPLKYPHVRPQMGNFATASRRESDPFPPTWSQGAQRNSLGPRGQNRRRTSGWELEKPQSELPYDIKRCEALSAISGPASTHVAPRRGIFGRSQA